MTMKLITSDFALTTNDILNSVSIHCLTCHVPIQMDMDAYLYSERIDGEMTENYNIQCDCDADEQPCLVLRTHVLEVEE